MDLRIELEVFGISGNPIRQTAYALLLRETDGDRRIPIVIGMTEAQSIALRLEKIIPPRPMSHDLMTSMMHAFGLELLEVFIYDFDEGVFQCRMKMVDFQERVVDLESRVSDAIAIAMRTGAPIYTTPEVMDKTSFAMTPSLLDDDQPASMLRRETKPERLEDMTEDALNRSLQRAIDTENYERAAEIHRHLTARREKGKSGE